MSWYYDRGSGNIVELTGQAKWMADTEISLEKLDPIVPQVWFGPYNTQAEAETFKTANPSVVDQAKTAADTASKVIPDVAGSLTQFGNTLVKLSIRFAEAAVGIVLLAIAANAILKQTTGVDVAKTTAKAGKKAATIAAVA
jgi:hypothetical protein